MKRISRKQAIDDIRTRLMALVDDEHSICEVAAERGIFCGGFAQYTFHELKKLYPTIVRSRPHITPNELRDLADRWQVARRTVHDVPLACDSQLLEHEHQTCKGWDEWDDADIAHFHQQLCGEPVEIVPDPVTDPVTDAVPGDAPEVASGDAPE